MSSVSAYPLESRLQRLVNFVRGAGAAKAFTRVLHPRVGRHEPPPEYVVPVGRSVIVPANGSLPNIVLSPRTVPRIALALGREDDRVRRVLGAQEAHRTVVLHPHEGRGQVAAGVHDAAIDAQSLAFAAALMLLSAIVLICRNLVGSSG